MQSLWSISVWVFHRLFVFPFCVIKEAKGWKSSLNQAAYQKRRTEMKNDTDAPEWEIARKHTFEVLGYTQILEELQGYAVTQEAKEQIRELKPCLSETELRRSLRDTTQAKLLLEKTGMPPIPMMENMAEAVRHAENGDLLSAEQIEQTGMFLAAVSRLKAYLERGKQTEAGLAWYSDNLVSHQELREQIERTVRGGRIDDYASGVLRDIRRQMIQLEEKLREKAESALRANRAWLSDSFVSEKSGRFCIPVKKQFRSKVCGSAVEESASGTTIFVEPEAAGRYREELEWMRMAQEEEERRILYELTGLIAQKGDELRENIRVIIHLDFAFAKGKMSAERKAVEPRINLERRICLKKARHPFLDPKECVPLDLELPEGVRGVVITGPNTGGKTVCMKTAGLLCLMAGSGLHVPAEEADLPMNSQVLCDIGDGQSMADNLSTFSGHIKNVISILKRVNRESLVILDELGSGTDPLEGEGIAIAILEELRTSGALFLVTTHYPKVREYAGRFEEILPARMAFDRESLRPLYRLEPGKSGESCALYIAKQLGIPNRMLRRAAQEAYGQDKLPQTLVRELELDREDGELKKESGPRLEKTAPAPKEIRHGTEFVRGDSVLVLPDRKIGIVVKPADRQGNVLVQIRREKVMISHNRLKLKVAAAELYPEDYDFSIIFDSVENRKARHKMERAYREGMEARIEKGQEY